MRVCILKAIYKEGEIWSDWKLVMNPSDVDKSQDRLSRMTTPKTLRALIFNWITHLLLHSPDFTCQTPLFYTPLENHERCLRTFVPRFCRHRTAASGPERQTSKDHQCFASFSLGLLSVPKTINNAPRREERSKDLAESNRINNSGWSSRGGRGGCRAGLTAWIVYRVGYKTRKQRR